MNQLCEVLKENAEKLNIKWGWKIDPKQEYHKWVLYVELPIINHCDKLPESINQISFHTDKKGIGEDYNGDWDGKNASEQRIINWVSEVLMTAKIV
jgi:hypothetical protein